ncbi:MAG TPA: HAD-IA family hydrolase [Steroidobacter sp.]|nr:HAD-IA family hydrolase [Steroidobacter sp.]
MKTRLVVFDLDGTLIDSAAEIAHAVNDVLSSEGMPTLAVAAVRELIGHGARSTVARAYARSAGYRRGSAANARPDRALLDRLMRAYSRSCLAHCGMRSRVFPQVRSTLQRLRAAGVKLALVTNKEACFARPLLATHGLLDWFDPIVAGDTLSVRKPAPAPVRRCLTYHGVERAIMVGDSITDVRAARAAGLPIVLVAHGYYDLSGSRVCAPDGWLHSFGELSDHMYDRLLRSAVSSRSSTCR